MVYATGYYIMGNDQMDYERVYREFISNRLQIEVLGVTEEHHIVPRSHGGSDGQCNLVRLTPEDHLFAHALLAKIHGGGMGAALLLMLNKKSRRTSKLQRYLYALAKRTKSEHQKEAWADPVQREKLIEAGKRRWGSVGYSEKMGKLASERFKNLWQDKDYRSKMIEVRKRPKSEAWKQKMRVVLASSDFLERRAGAISAAWTSEKRAECAEKSRELWKNPEYRARCGGLKAVTDEMRARMGAPWKGSFWVTDDTVSYRVREGFEMPSGFRRGRAARAKG